MADRYEGDDSDFRWIEHPMTAVLVLLGAEDATVATGGDMTGGVDDLLDASQCILAFSTPSDLVSRQEKVADTRQWRVRGRANIARAQAEWEQERPYVCGCGKRCKTAGGLTSHKRSHG